MRGHLSYILTPCDPRIPPTEGSFSRRMARFAIELPEGRHRLRVDGYPDTAYRVKSITYGSTNLNKDLLQIDGGSRRNWSSPSRWLLLFFGRR